MTAHGCLPAATVVLVHGAWHDSWCWGFVGDLLSRAAIPWQAPDLGLRSVAEDVATVRAIIDDPARRFVLAGHSRGGIVVSLASAGRTNVDHLVYIAAPLVDEGQLRLPDRRETLSSRAVRTAGGEYSVDPALAAELLYGGCPPDVTRAAVARLRPTGVQDEQDVAGLAVGWRTISSTYVVCGRDRCLDPRDQRLMATRAGEVVELACGHSPFLSHPDQVAAVLVERAVRGGADERPGD